MALYLHTSYVQSLVLFTFLSLISFTSAGVSALLPLTSALYGSAFDVNITFGQSQTLLLQVDTGSSDTWALGRDWQCMQDLNNGTVVDTDRKHCLSGNTTFDYDAAGSEFELIEGQWLGDQYGAGDVYGIVGYEHLRIGDIELKHQEIGVANISLSVNDGINVGIFALGHPSITLVHADSFDLNQTLYGNMSLLGEHVPYATVLERLVKEGMEPYFSLALERTRMNEEVGFGGYLGLGTVPPVHHDPFVSTPVEVTHAIPESLTDGKPRVTEWTLTVQSVSYVSSHGSNARRNFSTQFQAVVDSGTSWINVPEDIASSVNSAFEPPATLSNDGTGVYNVACTAVAPEFFVEIGNATFEVDGRDLIWQSPEGGCYSNVLSSAANGGNGDVSLNFLGDPFLKNVVAVFDFGKDEMKFAQRRNSDGSAVATSRAPRGATAGMMCTLFVTIVVAVLVL